MAMKPEDALQAIAAARGDAVCVPTMTTSPAWRTIAPDDLSVGCVGFMGGASSLGLGLALARPDRRVLVFDGDGSLLMQLGSLATVAGAAPRNLVHFLFKNGVYHASGAQEIPGGGGVDFVAERARAPAALAALRGGADPRRAAHGSRRQDAHDGGHGHAVPPAGGAAARSAHRGLSGEPSSACVRRRGGDGGPRLWRRACARGDWPRARS